VGRERSQIRKVAPAGAPAGPEALAAHRVADSDARAAALLAFVATGATLREGCASLLGTGMGLGDVAGAALALLDADPMGVVRAIAAVCHGRREGEVADVRRALDGAGVHRESVILAPLADRTLDPATAVRRAEALRKRLASPTDHAYARFDLQNGVKDGAVTLSHSSLHLLEQHGGMPRLFPTSLNVVKFDGRLPDGFRIGGNLTLEEPEYQRFDPIRLPDTLWVEGDLDLEGCRRWDEVIPPGVRVDGKLRCLRVPGGVPVGVFREAQALLAMRELEACRERVRSVGFDPDLHGTTQRLEAALVAAGVNLARFKAAP
jgi:hypothetical protein